MKSIIGAFVLALLIVCVAVPNLVHARRAEGSSATGSFKFVLDDGATRFVEFNAKEGVDGQATGDMTFSDPVAIPVDDPDSGETGTEGVFVKAKFDCMTTIENRAVIGGEIYDSNVKSEIGQRVLLVIEDNGLEKDQLTWGIYQQPATGWVPSDAELKDDKGAGLTWTATDAEQKDDVGIKMPLSKVVACQSFPLASYDFPTIKEAGGDLHASR